MPVTLSDIKQASHVAFHFFNALERQTFEELEHWVGDHNKVDEKGQFGLRVIRYVQSDLPTSYSVQVSKKQRKRGYVWVSIRPATDTLKIFIKSVYRMPGFTPDGLHPLDAWGNVTQSKERTPASFPYLLEELGYLSKGITSLEEVRI